MIEGNGKGRDKGIVFGKKRKNLDLEGQATEAMAPMLKQGEVRECLNCNRKLGPTAFGRGRWVCKACEKKMDEKVRG
jgi:ribosomal protein L37AE/L43A